MTASPDCDDHPPSVADGIAGGGLSTLAARVDARFAAATARFSTGDRRVDRMDNRLHEIDHNTRAHAQRIDEFQRTTDARFDATDTRIDLVHENVKMHIALSAQQIRLTLIAATIAAASGWLLTLVLWATT